MFAVLTLREQLIEEFEEEHERSHIGRLSRLLLLVSLHPVDKMVLPPGQVRGCVHSFWSP